MPSAPWRQALRPASFRNAAFHVKAARTQVGRRVALHEYPQRDEVYPEDLGLKADQFNVEAIVIGPDYHRARDALIAALKTPGPGLLIHPYHGQRTVTLVSPARISESPEEGGLARFSLDFVEAGENTEPSAREDTQEAVIKASDAANAAIAADFARSFSVAGASDRLVSTMVGHARDAFGRLEKIQRGILPVARFSEWAGLAGAVTSQLATLIRHPEDFALGFLALSRATTPLSVPPVDALLAYRPLLAFGGGVGQATGRTASEIRQSETTSALFTLVRRAALVEAAVLAAQVDFDTHEEAVAMRDDLAARLDEAAAGLTSSASFADPEIREVPDSLYQALTALKVALTRDLGQRAIDAPRLASVTLPATLPALVAAWHIHGDAMRADEIIRRNRIRHPGFIPGGVALEILTPT
jgi:prophage DNA circulation protein